MKIALVTQGYQSAGGVQAVARWIVEEIQSSGHDVHVFNIGASSRDSLSRRLTSPSTWGNGVGVQRDAYELNVTHVGTALAELEPIRYLPTRALSDALSEYDVVQIVAGGPALALAAARSGRPTILQVATRVRWERSSIIPTLR